LARYCASDQYHHRALKAWKKIEKEERRCFTSNFVLDETLTLLARRTDYRFAAARGQAIYASSRLEIVRPDYTDEVAALALFTKYADQQVSFTDCVSFVLMRNHKLKTTFSFDDHFTYAGFQRWPA